MKALLLSLIVICYTLLYTAEGQNSLMLDSTELTITTVADSLFVPWEILWGPDSNIWLTQRNGYIKQIDPKTGVERQLVYIDEVETVSESGLLGMALHPQFPDSPYVYVVYTYENLSSQLREKLVRYSYKTDTLTDPSTLLENIPGASTHDGSRLLFDRDGKLLMTTGDAQMTSLPQNISALNGKTLRLNPDGSVPNDNPIPGSLVWSWGHRNAQGLCFSENGNLLSSEHGPGSDDEINLLLKGRNYGWPNVLGYCNTSGEINFCNDSNVVPPLIAWTPTIAPAGLDYYKHAAIPEWSNALLLVTLKERDLRLLKLSAGQDAVISETIYLNNQFGRIRDLCIGPDGAIYIATSNRDGRGSPIATDDRIIRLKNEAYIPPVDTTAISGPSFRAVAKVFPNPFSESATLEFSSSLAARTELLLEVFDTLGKAVLQREIRNNEKTLLNSSEWGGKGIYLYSIKYKDRLLYAGRLQVF